MAMRRHTEQAYLLRIWRDRAETPLRATLTSVAAPDHHRHFANLDELQRFLSTQTGPAQPSVSEKPRNMPASAYDHCTPDQAQPEDPNETTLA
jgi:hypothetical protein